MYSLLRGGGELSGIRKRGIERAWCEKSCVFCVFFSGISKYSVLFFGMWLSSVNSAVYVSSVMGSVLLYDLCLWLYAHATLFLLLQFVV